jgi:predicted Rossmann fold nucleotide-binding protein DprA/Smf involved in DNA uptake
MAVPNSIYAESSSGTNHLLQMGAKLVTTSNDILEVLNFDKPLLDPVLSRVEGKSPIEKQNLEPIEQAILEALRGQEKSINDLTKELKLDKPNKR